MGTLKGHAGTVCSVAFSADGKRVVSGATSFIVKIWNAETFAVVCNPRGCSRQCPEFQGGLDFCTHRLALKRSELRVWQVHTLRGHSDCVRSVSFSTDGTRVVSGSSDKFVKIWDSETGAEVCAPRGCSSWCGEFQAFLGLVRSLLGVEAV